MIGQNGGRNPGAPELGEGCVARAIPAENANLDGETVQRPGDGDKISQEAVAGGSPGWPARR